MEEKKEFDVQVMVESFQKAERTLSQVSNAKTHNVNDLKEIAIVFFNNSMSNIRESKKAKNKEVY